MKDQKRQDRMRVIEQHAHTLFRDIGFEGTSMLAIAKRAKASNETLYRWYGDKNGLFESMVRANADQVNHALKAAQEAGNTSLQTLSSVAEVLLGMLLSDEAIVLNRAAASDATGALGQILGQAGRDAVLPHIERVLHQAVANRELGQPVEGDIGSLFVRLLVGDQQIRRVIGTLNAPSSEEVRTQVARVVCQMRVLCPPRSS